MKLFYCWLLYKFTQLPTTVIHYIVIVQMAVGWKKLRPRALIATAASKINASAWSPDGKYMATGNDDGDIHIWDAGTGKLIQALARQPSWIQAIAWSSDGCYLASGCSGGYVHIWHPHTSSKTIIDPIQAHDGYLTTIIWNPVHNICLTMAADQFVIKLWTEKGKLLHKLWSDASQFSSVLWHPTGSRLCATDYEGRIYLWAAI